MELICLKCVDRYINIEIMSEFSPEFAPQAFDPVTVAAGLRMDLEAFEKYVVQEIEGVQLFGAIIMRLSQDRSDEMLVDTDIVGGRAGLEMKEYTGSLPERHTNPDTPMVQDVYYPTVPLPDGTHAVLKTTSYYKNGIDSEVFTQIPGLCIVTDDVLRQFQDGKIGSLVKGAKELYYRHNLDGTGHIMEAAPFAGAHNAYFLHPLTEEWQADIARHRNTLQRDQQAYLSRLRMIAGIVLGNPQAG